MTSALDAALAEFARQPAVLVACDFDGTLAPIVDDPAAAAPLRESVVALRRLASMGDHTHVAVISGRSLRDLATLSRLPDEVHLVGSHGSEFDIGFASALNGRQQTLMDTITDAVRAAVRATPGSSLEAKPASVAFHFRRSPAQSAAQAVHQLEESVGALADVHVKYGRMVLEFGVVDTNKGDAVDAIRHQLHVDSVLFVGDDVTDEDAFARLSGPDLSVKVGSAPTVANHRVRDPLEVAQMLARLVDMRRDWVEGHSAAPIQRHTLLSDRRHLALLTPDARLSWLCAPRPDSPAVFAELIGGPDAGYFSIRPDPERLPLDQHYLRDTMAVQTRWATARLTDYFDLTAGEGRGRLVRVVEGDGEVVAEFAPRADFGRSPTVLDAADTGVDVTTGAVPLRLRSEGVAWQIERGEFHDTARATIALIPGQPVVLRLDIGDVDDAGDWSEPAASAASTQTWREWAGQLTVDDPLLRRSAMTLRSLVYAPTGAVLAAATSSLPEVIGGVRNWDYRFCWPRDASHMARELVAAGCTDDAEALLRWIGERVANTHPGGDGPAAPSAERLRPLYPLVGDEFLPEAVIPTLNGYRGSRPVRVGNLAEHQLQLDMFGPIVELVDDLTAAGRCLDHQTADLLAGLVQAVVTRWREPDHGIWEDRRPPRHYVHSKVMCWVALDRGAQAAQRLREAGISTIDEVTVAMWIAERDLVAEQVVDRGWNDRVGAFTSAYDDDELDAAILQLVTCGLLPGTDERVVSTVAAVERELRDGVSVYRYLHDDGLPGREGGFLLCTAWLIEAMAAVGRLDDADALLTRYRALAGPTGLFAEQFDPNTETALGNFPQGYSHAGLLRATRLLGVAAGVS